MVLNNRNLEDLFIKIMDITVYIIHIVDYI